ncbi:MAG: hypothetical protein D6785_15305, partial [Planctomycetota bacterium]
MKIKPPFSLLKLKNLEIYSPEPLGKGEIFLVGEKILGVNPKDNLNLSAFPMKEISLDGYSILPGLIESHIHLIPFVRSRREILLDSQWSKKKILEVLTQHIKNIPKGSWIFGRGWNRNNWTNSDFPTKEELDRISTSHKIGLSSRDGHSAWLNSAALEELKITKE